MSRQSVIAVGLVASMAGCVPTIRHQNAFSSRFADNNRANVHTVYTRLPSEPPAQRAANALGVPLVAAIRQGTPRGVVLFDLAANRQLWSVDLPASSAPDILGDIVVVGAGAQVVGLDLRTGQRKWSIETRGMAYMGGAREGDSIVLVMSLGVQGGASRVGRVVAVNAQSGSESWSHDVVGILGRPAASGGHAFVPWDRQSIAVLDMATGDERARVRTTDDVLSWVFATRQGLFYGSRGLYRWTDRSASGTRANSAYLANPLTNVPGDPPLYRDAFAATTGTRTARDKISFAFRPRIAERDSMAVEHDTLYLAYYRFLIAVNATTGEARWARAIGPEETTAAAGESANAAEAARRAQASFSAYDIESVTVLPNAVVVVGGNGRIRAFDPATGAVLGTADLGVQIGALATDLTGYRPPTTGASGPPEGTPRDQIVSLIRDTDNRLVPIRGYLVSLLARRPEQEVTRDLLELYRQRSIPTSLRQEIATALRARRNGAQFLLAAIEGDEGHYNFLENRQAPPLDVIAPTLASMGAREAVPVLLQHMLDHETSLASLPPVISAVADLGDASAIPQLQSFVQRYKADSSFAGDKSVPLQTAAAAIFRLGDASARGWLTALSQDASAHALLRSSITHLFEEERSGGERRTGEQQVAEAREALEGRINGLRAAVAAHPTMLTLEAFESEWSNHIDELRECAQGVLVRLPNLNQIRITVTVRSEAPAGMFNTRPPEPNLSRTASFAQRLHAIEEQTAWVDHQLAQLQAHQSAVRTLAYSPQDRQMQECMNHVLQAVHFPGFGRSISSRTFQQSISTVRAAARTNSSPGFGVPEGSSALVPWFLVSSPSFDRTTGQIVAPAAPAGSTGTATPAGATGTTTGRTNATGTGTASGTTATGTAATTSPTTRPGQTGRAGADAGAPSSGQPNPAQPASGNRPWWEE